MSDTSTDQQGAQDFGTRLLFVLSLSLVVIGLINSTPGIPGYDDFAASIWGQNGVRFRKFSTEWFYPVVFSLMMCVVVHDFNHLLGRD